MGVLLWTFCFLCRHNTHTHTTLPTPHTLHITQTHHTITHTLYTPHTHHICTPHTMSQRQHLKNQFPVTPDGSFYTYSHIELLFLCLWSTSLPLIKQHPCQSWPIGPRTRFSKARETQPWGFSWSSWRKAGFGIVSHNLGVARRDLATMRGAFIWEQSQHRGEKGCNKKFRPGSPAKSPFPHFPLMTIRLCFFSVSVEFFCFVLLQLAFLSFAFWKFLTN